MKTKWIYAVLTGLTLGAGQAQAVVDAAVSYDSLGLSSARYLVSDRLEQARIGSVALDQNHLRQPSDGQRTSSLLGLTADATELGDMNTYSWLATGGYATSSASWIQSVQNSTGAAHDYALALSLSNMELALGGWSGDYRTGDFRAGFDVDVSINGVSVWHAGRSLLQQADGVHTASRGQQLGLESLQVATREHGISYYSVSDFHTDVDLGTLANGASFNVVYTLRSFSYWGRSGWMRL